MKQDCTLTLAELVCEVYEKTHFPEIEILHRVRSAWPMHTHFTPTQCALMVRAIERDQGSTQTPRTLTDGQIWGKA